MVSETNFIITGGPIATTQSTWLDCSRWMSNGYFCRFFDIPRSRKQVHRSKFCLKTTFSVDHIPKTSYFSETYQHTPNRKNVDFMRPPRFLWICSLDIHLGHLARLLQMDVKTPENQSVRSRKKIYGFFDLKIAIFSTAHVLENRSMCLFLLYISRRTDFPIVSTHRSEGICPKSCDFPSTRLYICIM